MLKDDCLYCKIIRGEIPSKKMYEDEEMLIFCDIEPKCKYHYLLVLKDHFATFAEMTQQQGEVFVHCLQKLKELETPLHLENGFRCVINQGEDAGQTVHHLHVHILAGEKMGWTPA